MTFRVAVSGASGYAGGEVLRLLTSHPQAEIGSITAHSNAGQTLGSLQPHLQALADRVLEPTDVDVLRGHDVVFLPLPHGASADIAAQLSKDTLVIDAGADHRLDDAAMWEKFYGSPHAGTWPYGLPELPGKREKLINAKRIAVPGCYPTGSLLGLAPGFKAGVLQADDVVIVAASGTSGAGKSLKSHLLGSETMGSMSPYGVGGMHRHTPEVIQGLSSVAGEDVSISFTPTLAPMPRGILTTATAKYMPGATVEEIRAAWETAYQDEPFVHLLPGGQWPSIECLLGSIHAVVRLAVDVAAGRVIVLIAIDNLTKGTAGGAVQSMNIGLGLPEEPCLTVHGVAP